MLSALGAVRVRATQSDSFALDLKKWLGIMEAYEGGGHAYHATLPTDALRSFRDAMAETKTAGFAAMKAAQARLGAGARAMLAEKQVAPVAADGFGAPGVVVSYTDDP